jgi:hypothetical protein
MTVDFFGVTINRNAGLFHEPGGYAVFLNISIAVNLIRENVLFSGKNIFLILIVFLTTFSTAGMIGVFIIVLFYYYNNKRLQNLQRLILLLFFGTIIFFLFSNSQFLESKIQERYRNEATKGLDEETAGRFYAARKSILVLSRYPITGRGLIEGTRAEEGSDESTGGYGFMAFFAQFGIIISVFFLYYFYRAFGRISYFFHKHSNYSTAFFYSLAVGLFSQPFISTPIIGIIFFIGYLECKYPIKTDSFKVLS